MLTPQEVSNRAFPKAMMGGYNMGAVDEFLDELTEDYSTLYKENAALKAKMKVLVERVEEYRATEDAMRSTLLTAQKMADSIVKDAEAKRDHLALQAEADARSKIGEMRSELVEAQERLRAGQQELATFISASRELCAQELKFLDQLPKLKMEPPAAAIEAQEQKKREETAGEIEQNLYASFQAEEEPANEEPPTEEEAPPEEKEEPTRRMDLKELKFGRNYLGGDQ